MAYAIDWDVYGEKTVENGVDRGALWIPTIDSNGSVTYGNTVAWSGLTAVNEAPTGGEPQDMWADNIKYMSLMSQEQFAFTIEAYMFPQEFYACDGGVNYNGCVVTQQARSPFCFSWRTKIANEIEGFEYGYKLHFAWGCLAKPSSKDRSTLNDTPEGATFSWEVTTTPIQTSITVGSSGNTTTKVVPVSHLCIDTTQLTSAQKTKLTALESSIYGTAASGSSGSATQGIYMTPSAVISAMAST